MGSKRIPYGARKNRKLKIKMKKCNINKHLSKTSENNPSTENVDESVNPGNDFPNDTINNCVLIETCNLTNNAPVSAPVESSSNSPGDVKEFNEVDEDEAVDEDETGDEDETVDEIETVDEDETGDEGETGDVEDAAADEVEAESMNSDSIDSTDEKQIEGRRLIEVNYFYNQIQKISLHNSECTINDVQIDREIRSGLDSQIILECKKCGQRFRAFNTKARKNTPDNMCINSTAVLGTNMIGIGYSQLEQFASVLNIPVMCADKYKSINDTVGIFWEETAIESMRVAAEEEQQAAVARGDVDDDGVSYITVVTDGCWSKRSYKRNFTALSGVSAIVGLFTGKVLWIGVRNKYCVTCVRNANKNLDPPQHFCTKNYSGPSSDMEWQAILEGFQSSVDMYNLRYLKLVADGDSSTYAKIMEHKPYGNRFIEKFECKNHLLRNFRALIGHATTGCPRGLNQHVCKSLERIRKGICSAIQFRKSEDKTDSEKIMLLKSDINNVIHHVFGDHSNCPPYIHEHCKDEKNVIPDLINCGTYEKLAQPIRRLMYCASDLILGYTNNIAEHFNSIVAKFVGGKRVNFSLSNSYKHKSNAAAVQFNEKLPLTALFRTKFNTNPPSVAKKVELKRLQKSEREKARRKRNKENKIRPKRFCRNKQAGSGYGLHSEKADLSPADFENEKKILLDKLKANQQNRLSIEERARDKYCPLFQETSSNVIMASDFGSICKARVLAGYVKTISQGTYAKTKAVKHEDESLSIALQQLAKEQEINIRRSGLTIDSNHNCLAAYPTGVVESLDVLETTIVNIQCPLTIFNKNPNDPTVLVKLPYMEVGPDKRTFGIKRTDNLYYQIQGELMICNANSCLLAIWTSSQYEMYVERIEREETFFDTKMKSQLLSFYYDWLLPELVDPRLIRCMPVRVPKESSESAERIETAEIDDSSDFDDSDE